MLYVDPDTVFVELFHYAIKGFYMKTIRGVCTRTCVCVFVVVVLGR